MDSQQRVGQVLSMRVGAEDTRRSLGETAQLTQVRHFNGAFPPALGVQILVPQKGQGRGRKRVKEKRKGRRGEKKAGKKEGEKEGGKEGRKAGGKEGGEEGREGRRRERQEEQPHPQGCFSYFSLVVQDWGFEPELLTSKPCIVH